MVLKISFGFQQKLTVNDQDLDQDQDQNFNKNSQLMIFPSL